MFSAEPRWRPSSPVTGTIPRTTKPLRPVSTPLKGLRSLFTARTELRKLLRSSETSSHSPFRLTCFFRHWRRNDLAGGR